MRRSCLRTRLKAKQFLFVRSVRLPRGSARGKQADRHGPAKAGHYVQMRNALMERKSFSRMQCPIARSLERVGEWWSILILRDALQGVTRFDQFQKSLDIAPNMLTRRL